MRLLYRGIFNAREPVLYIMGRPSILVLSEGLDPATTRLRHTRGDGVGVGEGRSLLPE